MFFNKKFNSLEVAREIIKNTGLDENLGILKQKKYEVPTPAKDVLKLVMALSTCNLVQAMKADFIIREITEEERGAITREYVLESFRKQDLIPLSGKEEMEEVRQGVMAIVTELQEFWVGTEDPPGSGPGPRYYCVKEILGRLGGQQNYELHDALFELMYLQYKHYLSFFTGYLEG